MPKGAVFSFLSLHDGCGTGVPQLVHDQAGGLWLRGQQASWRIPCKQPADGQAAAQGHWPGWQESSPNGKPTHFVHQYALSYERVEAEYTAICSVLSCTCSSRAMLHLCCCYCSCWRPAKHGSDCSQMISSTACLHHSGFYSLRS